ncbi:hypothetical protein [Arthrobacter sp. B6]|uniref:hypothetical protein n=1 Tax=Arthrobacter sp. B6 TaxID=1570137 RepID=UPI000B009800|nr:hypothetical protein [Arthrobacter sp. B6]
MTALDGVDVALVQSQSIGYDGVASVLPDGCLFAIAAGVHEPSTAELAWGMMISSQRGMPDFVRNQEKAPGTNSQRPSLADRRVLLATPMPKSAEGPQLYVRAPPAAAIGN